jgi:II/X family phage/plasmid replication protein
VIDWITMTAPLSHDSAITGGMVFSVDQNGQQEWRVHRRKSVRGSFDSTIQVRTCSHTVEQCTHVEISGNPVKWFQGHNLWGTDDLHALAVATLEHVAMLLAVTVVHAEREAWEAGCIRLSRVDLTQSFHLNNRNDVLAFLRAAEQTAHLSHRGRGQLVKGSTLYFGKSSRRWSLKLYSKGQEIEAKGHGQDAILQLPSAREWADRTLRAELTLRGLELQRLGLRQVRDWKSADDAPDMVTRQLLAERLGGMTMMTNTTLQPQVLATLRPALRTAVLAWESGSDLRSILSRRSFYRYRSELLQHGIDIAVPQPREASNVVPLIRILEAKPVGVPDWAQGTKLYFEPRKIA